MARGYSPLPDWGVTLVVDETQYSRLVNELRHIPGAVELAARTATNRTATAARSAIVKALSQTSGLKQKDARKSVRFWPASVRKEYALIAIKRRRIAVKELEPRQTQKGVTYRHGKARNLIAHAFIANVYAKVTDVYVRQGRNRFPVVKQWASTDAVQEMIDSGALERITFDARARMAHECAGQIRRILAGHSRLGKA